MSDVEALMWNIDDDPWLSPSGCSLLILDGPVDVDHSAATSPALAVVWSFLLLGETLRGGQFVGIAIALSGLLVFIVMNQRGDQRRMVEPPGSVDRGLGDLPDRVGVLSVELGDEVRDGFHAPISRLTEAPCGGDVARVGGDAGQCVECEDFDVAVAVAPGVVEEGDETFLGAGFPIRRVHRGQEALADRGLSAETTPIDAESGRDL